MEFPKAILRQAEQQHGVVRYDDLRDAGVSHSGVNRLLAKDWLDSVHRGVFRLAGTPSSWEQRQLAACLSSDGVASHRAALRLWGIDLSIDVPVELTVTRPQAPKPAGAVVHRARDLDPARTVRRNGIPVTDPLRMLVDLGAVVDQYLVSRALGKCIVSRLVTAKAARAELDRLAKRGRRGAGVLRKVLDDWTLGTARPDSVLEVAFSRLIRSHALPRPEFQFDLVIGGRRRRLDFAYPTERVAIEVDGFESHADREVFQDDRWRQNDLVSSGWHVVRFTWQDVLYRPEYVAATITTVLGKRRTA